MDGLIQWWHFWTDLSRLSKVSGSSHEFTRRCSHLWHWGREGENKSDLLFSLPLSFLRASPVSQQVMQETQETQLWSLGWENPLEEEMALQCSCLKYSDPLQHNCLKNSMDGGAWWATAQRAAKRHTGVSCWVSHSDPATLPYLGFQSTMPLASFSWPEISTITRVYDTEDQVNENMRKYLSAHLEKG